MQALLEKPHAFSFFQLVRILQHYAGGAPIGRQGPVTEETLRLRPALSLAFPAADVQAVETLGDTASGRPRFRITTNFMGLCSSDSPLPTYFTEDMLWKETDQRAVRLFLDIFHHRALSLLYRTWEKYRYPVQFRHRGEDEISERVFSLVGLGTLRLRESTGLPSVRLLRYAGIFSHHPHSATGLAAALRDYFALPSIGVEQCVERRVRIDSGQQNRLGIRNCSLGRNLTLGESVRDRTGKFRVTTGPLDLPQFKRFLPVSDSYAALVNLTRLLVYDRLDFDIRLTLRASETPRLILSSTAPQRLGWTSCLAPLRENPSVLLRQPRRQIPLTVYPWPEPAAADTPVMPRGASEIHDRR